MTWSAIFIRSWLLLASGISLMLQARRLGTGGVVGTTFRVRAWQVSFYRYASSVMVPIDML